MCVILFLSLEIKSIVKLKKNVAEKERERETMMLKSSLKNVERCAKKNEGFRVAFDTINI